MKQSDSLLEFPCRFPIKALGPAHVQLDSKVIEIINRHAPGVADRSIKRRLSKGRKYIAVTVIITATSQEQLNNIYHELTKCPQVMMAF